MLSCLDKESRLIFILSESYGVTSQEGALILDITPDAYRARLSRGKKLLQQFMEQRCGLVNKNNSCQCHQPAAIRLQHQSGVKSSISCSAQLSSKKGRDELLAQLDEFEEIERVIAMFRLYPEYDSPDSFSHIVSNLMESGRYQVLN
ncbi:RNA polymerase sigma-54 factor RpoN [Vibrio ponticus]|nr:RNA polymerase sigma-54 factor RpoN [Vibrio ponticus]